MFDPDLSKPVNYRVNDPKDAPQNLTYGPSYIDLAAALPNPITLGLNRRLNYLDDITAAAELAYKKIPTLYAIELGNEPDRK